MNPETRGKIKGIIAYTTDIKYNDLAKKVSIPLNGALQMRIEAIGHGLNVNSISKCSYGFSDGKFEYFSKHQKTCIGIGTRLFHS